MSSSTPNPTTSEAGTPPAQDPYPFAENSWLSKTVMGLAIGLPFIGLAYAIVTLWGLWVTWLDLALFFGGWAITTTGITLGYHRMLAHKAFDARAPLRLGLLIAAVMSLEGRPSDWAATHIKHHAKSDKPGDPHSPVEGFVHSHFGWLMAGRLVRTGPVHDNLRKDWVVRFVDRTWGLWVVLGFALPAIIAGAVTGTWMGALQGFMWGTGARIFFVHHVTWSVNSLGHVFGTRPYDTPDRSRNSGLLALLSFGEGWHNNHHALPRSPFIGLRWYQIDFGGYLLRFFKAIGLVRSWWVPRKMPERASRRKSSAARSARST